MYGPLFRRTYFRDILCGVNDTWYKKSWKEFVELKNIDQYYYCSNYCDVSVNKYCVKCRTSLRLRGNKGCINPIDPRVWFQRYFKYWLNKESRWEKTNCYMERSCK